MIRFPPFRFGRSPVFLQGSAPVDGDVLIVSGSTDTNANTAYTYDVDGANGARFYAANSYLLYHNGTQWVIEDPFGDVVENVPGSASGFPPTDWGDGVTVLKS